MTPSPALLGPYTTLRSGDGGVITIALHPVRGTSLSLSLALLRELELRLQEIEEASSLGEASLLLIETAPADTALTGYDLEEIRTLTSPGIFDWSQEAQSILRRLEQLPIPTIAVVQGDWAGGAAELALACSHRVAAASPEARIALPQTRRGLVPAWGGTVRLPRLIGLHRALRLVLSGEAIGAKEALEIGLVDQLIPVAEFDERLSKYVLGLAANAARGSRGSRRRRTVSRRLIEETAPGRRLLAARASRRYLMDPSATLATPLALELILESSALPLAEAFDRESRFAGELIVTHETRGRLHSERVTEQAAKHPATGTTEPESAAVIGAGETGSDLAYLLLRGGGPVRIKDVRAAARTGVARARSRIAWDVRQGRLVEDDGKQRSAMVEGVSGFGGFGLLDVAVLATDGTPYSAEELAAEVEAHIQEDCLVAFHDWTLSPGELQRRLARPDRLIAVSPAFPIDGFPLLEILPGPQTSPGTVAEARRLAQQCGLTPVLVREPAPSPGVRLLSIYFAEAGRLLEAGATVATIDAAMEGFGFSVGPFRRMDAIGTARAGRMLRSVAEVLGDRVAPVAAIGEVAASGGTFYRYRGGRPKGASSQLPEPGHEPGGGFSLGLRRRILLLLINEAVRILEDGCVDDPADLDMISILALGFPREHGGLLYHAERTGLPAVAEDLREAARQGEAYFAPTRLLEQLAAEGRGFFAEGYRRSGHDSDAVLQ